MSEQARKVKHEAVPQWAEGLYYNKGLDSEATIAGMEAWCILIRRTSENTPSSSTLSIR
jgi:hypothetical protein